MILKIPLHLLSLQEDGFHLFVCAELNGKPAHLLVDTGASKTVFDINRISQFVTKKKKSFRSIKHLSTGLGSNSMKVSYTLVKEFCISELKFENFEAFLLDMTHVNESYRMLGNEPIDGVLGGDLLMEYKAVIDYDKRLLKLKI